MPDYEAPKPGSQQFPGQNAELIRGILQSHKKVAMVGLSANPNRPSFFAATYLKDYGFEITPVNPAYQEVMGLKCYPDLDSVPGALEVVDIFRKPEDVPGIVADAIRLGAKVIWMQLGVVNLAARQTALDAGLKVVMDRCMKIEHARYHGGMNVTGLRTGVISAKKTRL
ncbi:MAG: CoA-binding protein [Candidatus Lambdaproteobacteria bacterium]|nr:CoA-binding protein [Candidatus Lambdaproteobacteria bacterium]